METDQKEEATGEAFVVRYAATRREMVECSRAFWMDQNSGMMWWGAVPALASAGCFASDVATSRAGAAASGFLAGVAATMFFFVAWQHAGLAQALRSHQPGEDLEVTYTFSRDGVAVESEEGQSCHNWTVLDGLWRHPRFWLLLSAGNPSILLPASLLSDDAREFIARHVTEAGGAIMR